MFFTEKNGGSINNKQNFLFFINLTELLSLLKILIEDIYSHSMRSAIVEIKWISYNSYLNVIEFFRFFGNFYMMITFQIIVIYNILLRFPLFLVIPWPCWLVICVFKLSFLVKDESQWTQVNIYNIKTEHISVIKHLVFINYFGKTLTLK